MGRVEPFEKTPRSLRLGNIVAKVFFFFSFYHCFILSLSLSFALCLNWN